VVVAVRAMARATARAMVRAMAMMTEAEVAVCCGGRGGMHGWGGAVVAVHLTISGGMNMKPEAKNSACRGQYEEMGYEKLKWDTCENCSLLTCP
jgi:hypothetical protein